MSEDRALTLRDMKALGQSQETITLAYGVELPADVPEPVFLRAQSMVDEYRQAAYDNVNRYIGRVLGVCGVIIHEFDMPVDEGRTVIDVETGEQVSTEVRKRTVIKVLEVDGRNLEEPAYVGFVSEVIARQFINVYIKRYGSHDWRDAEGNVRIIHFIFDNQQTRAGRRTYSMRCVE